MRSDGACLPACLPTCLLACLPAGRPANIYIEPLSPFSTKQPATNNNLPSCLQGELPEGWGARRLIVAADLAGQLAEKFGVQLATLATLKCAPFFVLLLLFWVSGGCSAVRDSSSSSSSSALHSPCSLPVLEGSQNNSEIKINRQAL